MKTEKMNWQIDMGGRAAIAFGLQLGGSQVMRTLRSSPSETARVAVTFCCALERVVYVEIAMGFL